MEISLPKKFRCSSTARQSLVFSVGIMILFLITASWFLVSSRSLIFPLRAEVAEDIQAAENTTKIDSGDHGDGRLILDAGDIALAQSKESAKAEFGFDKFPLVVKTAEDPKPYENSAKTVTGRLDSNTSTWTPARQRPSSHTSNSGKAMFGDCDLYHGKWIYDPTGPLYTNSTCPILTQSQNCQGNGRPDKGYENWRWKPDQCNIPRFDARKFLEMMKGKILAFIGDSVARNQMESMLCILWQVETPRMRGNRRMHRWYFRSTSTTIVRIWSSWLVGKSTDESAPRGIVRVHLDKPDEAFFEFLPMFDVVVLSSGHWFSKRSIYLINGEIVGSQLWHSERSQKNHINSMSAYTIAMKTILSALATHPNYTGVTILRTYSPDHYKGGSCSNNGEPAKKPAGNGHTAMMHDRQVEGFKAAVEKVKNGSKLRLMDITEVFGYRDDGHPGRYRSPDAKNSKGRHLSGKTQTEDCLHWCMPGPVDVWNAILFEILKRELQVEQVKI